MVHNDRLLVTLIHAFAAARGLSVSYASRLLTGSGDTVDRVTAGASITARRAETILRRASQSWPADRAWPADIPRPEPAEESRGGRQEKSRAMTQCLQGGAPPTSPCPPPPKAEGERRRRQPFLPLLPGGEERAGVRRGPERDVLRPPPSEARNMKGRSE